ncbi:unnamed protein product, partial [Bubo scandiacus]
KYLPLVLDCTNRNKDLNYADKQSWLVTLLSCTQYVVSNMILTYAMEQGGMRNPILGKADVATAPSSSPQKVGGNGQQRKRGVNTVKSLSAPMMNVELWNNTEKFLVLIKTDGSDFLCVFFICFLPPYTCKICLRNDPLQKEPALTHWDSGCALFLLV